MAMWVIRAIEQREVTLDFTSSDQSRHTFRAAYSEDTCLFNACELLQLEDGRVQAHVCESCGYPGCEPGSWVSFRRCGNHVLLIPAFDAMREGEWERGEYSPPRYIMKKGVPALTEDAYAVLQRSFAKLPVHDRIKQCSPTDVVGLLQLAAPARILGPIDAAPNLNADMLVAVSQGDLPTQISAFLDLLDLLGSGEGEVPLAVPDEIVTFYLDMSPFTEWSPFGYLAGQPIVNIRDLFGEAVAGDA